MSSATMRNQPGLLSPETLTKIGNLSKDEIIELVKLQQQSIALLARENERLRKIAKRPRQEALALKDELLIIRHKMFGKSSEKSPDPEDVEKESKKRKKAKKRKPPVLLPSLRYPDLPLMESTVEYEKDNEPQCSLCHGKLTAMNVTENSEYITVTEKTYYITRQMRMKYRCPSCHGDIRTAPGIPRIVKGGAYSDEIAIDVAISKYCDHLPVERYVNQAERAGLIGVSPQSLIEQTHFLADFVEKPVYYRIKGSVQGDEAVLFADETRWNMLEGDEKSSWQMWGFFNERNSYLSATDTRAADVAIDFLKDCKAKYLLSDAYQGYGKAGKKAGKQNAYCNAHARRKFKDAEKSFKEEADPVIEFYRELYKIEKEIKHLAQEEKAKIRHEKSKSIWKDMTVYIQKLHVLPKSSIGKARRYFLKYHAGLKLFLDEGVIPIDNNLSERALRGPVVGRKNYYGNHSRRGAKTTSILLSIVESCKINNVEPRRYLRDTVKAIHEDGAVLTPAEYADKHQTRITPPDPDPVG